VNSLGFINPQTAFDSSADGLRQAFERVSQPLFLIIDGDRPGVSPADFGALGSAGNGGRPLAAIVPACHPHLLGDQGFCRDYGIRYAYLGGSMAHGISSAAIAEELGKNGMLGFFGAAGCAPDTVAAAIDRLSASLPDRPFGFNLIHSPNEPELEKAIVELYIKRGIRLVEASAFLNITLPLVRYRVHGIHQDRDGNIVTPNRVIGKVSRIEVGTRFFSPPPDKMLHELVQLGEITEAQANMAAAIPVAQDLTAEADSGGHTDNRPAVTLLPTIIALRDRMQKQHAFKVPLRVGLGGGIATPHSAAAAFAMGAAYLMVGSVHQACVESGVSPAAREMLCQAQQADMTMAPAGDMFEMGVTVQVLKRGTMFAMRASKLGELYRNCRSLDDIPANDRAMLEKSVFQAPLTTIWDQTRSFFLQRDPRQVERAEAEPKHKMALVFRWYLGQSPRWAVSGEPSRKVDFQIWCGPAMGAFNEWVKGSGFEPAQGRRVVPIARNLLFGAAVAVRHHFARCQGVSLPPEVMQINPSPANRLEEFFS
jgi:PfaD family protein